MDAPSHTPGPWSEGLSEWSVDNDGENTCAHILADNREDPICIVVEGAAFGRDAQLDANARLIAAAPDLLEALRHHYEQDLPFAERQALAKAAIARAEAGLDLP